MTERAQPDPVLTSASGLQDLRGGLFVQSKLDGVTPMISLVSSYGLGAVLTGDPARRRYARSDFLGAVKQLRRVHPDVDVLMDANLYSGKRRKPAIEQLNRDWITTQRELGLPWAMTDSGYCGEGDIAGLQALLSNGTRLGSRVITMLPLSIRWLIDDPDLLRTEIEKQGNPVALILENENDPLDQKGAIGGLVALLAGAVPVLLLRSDTGALGALAHGAAHAAVGTLSSLRHLYPVVPGGGPSRHLSFVIPRLLGYYLHSRFEGAHTADPNHPAWLCGCTFCGGRDLSWIANSHDNDDSAFKHSIAAIAEMGASLITAAARVSSAQAWTNMCAAAQMEHLNVSNVNGSSWQPKKALSEWIKVTPTSVGV